MARKATTAPARASRARKSSLPAALDAPAGGGRFRADYDATIPKRNRRQEPRTETYREDEHLPGEGRKTLLATARDQVRNFPLAGWALRKHLNSVCGHTLQVRTTDNDFNNDIEARWRAWANDPDQYHSAGKHTHDSLMVLAESSAMIDGDCFLVLRADGRVQLIESERVRNPEKKEKGEVVVDGVRLDLDGRALAYAVHTRGEDGRQLKFEQWLSAEWVIHHGYFQRADQVRGITPTAPAQNQGQDIYESQEHIGLAMKIRNMLMFAVERETPVDAQGRPVVFPGAGGSGGSGGAEGGKSAGGASGSGSDADAFTKGFRNRLPLDVLKGVSALNLKPGQKINLLESHAPAMEVQSYIERMVRWYLLAYDIPLTFYDVKGSTYSGARQEMLQHFQSARPKRRRNAGNCDRIFAWWLARNVAKGEIDLPDDYTVPTLPRHWIAPGLPWIDPLKEISAYKEALAMRVTSRTRIARELYGEDYDEIEEELAHEEKRLAARGVNPVLSAPGTAPAAPVQPDASDPKDDDDKPSIPPGDDDA